MTFTVFFTFATPANPLPDIKIDDPQGALALVTAVANIFLFFLLLSFLFLTPFFFDRLSVLSPYTVTITLSTTKVPHP